MEDDSQEREATEDLAKNLVAEFSNRKGFETGLVGYSQVTTLESYSSIHYSSESFDATVGSMRWNEGETHNAKAISVGDMFLTQSYSRAKVMVVIVQAESTGIFGGFSGTDYFFGSVQTWAEDARGKGITVLAIRGIREGEGNY